MLELLAFAILREHVLKCCLSIPPPHLQYLTPLTNSHLSRAVLPTVWGYTPRVECVGGVANVILRAVRVPRVRQMEECYSLVVSALMVFYRHGTDSPGAFTPPSLKMLNVIPLCYQFYNSNVSWFDWSQILVCFWDFNVTLYVLVTFMTHSGRI